MYVFNLLEFSKAKGLGDTFTASKEDGGYSTGQMLGKKIAELGGTGIIAESSRDGGTILYAYHPDINPFYDVPEDQENK